MIRENADLLNFVTSSAILSTDGLHRFRLDRAVADSGPSYAFIGVNPSTADATLDDATVRKWKGFVKRWGGAKFSVVNLFTFRATDVRELAEQKQLNTLASGTHITSALRTADVVVPCWGNIAKIPQQHRGRAKEIANFLSTLDKPVKCFGFTKSGDPKHPLMLGYDTPLVDFPA